MSLLLDALQRASKEKEKLAESRASGGESLTKPMPESREPFPSIALDQEVEPPAGSGFAELSIEPLQPKAESVAPKREVPIDPVVAGAEEEFASIQPKATVPSESLTHQPAATPTNGATAAAPADTSASSKDMELLAAVEPSPRLPGAVSHDATRSNGSRIGIAEMPSQPASTPAKNAFVKEARSAEISPEIAREILGVTAKPKPKPRTLVLAAVAISVVVGYGAFWFGAFDSLLGSPASSLTPQNPPPVAAPVAAPVAVAASVPPEDPRATSNVDTKDSHAEVKATPLALADEAPAKRVLAASSGGEPASESARSSQRGKPRSASPTPRPVVVARTSQPAYLDLAYAALGEGRLGDARNFYRKALESNSAERDALLGMAYIAHREGDNESARSNYEQVLRIDPNNPVATSGLLAIFADGDLALSAARARDFAERVPDSAFALANLGAMLAREGRIAEAQQAYFKALALEPDNPLHAYNLAVALDKLHKYSQAEAFYGKALKLAEKANAAEKAGLPLREARQRLDEIRQSVPGRGGLPETPPK